MTVPRFVLGTLGGRVDIASIAPGTDFSHRTHVTALRPILRPGVSMLVREQLLACIFFLKSILL